jgi:hypothetical protein
MERIMVRSSVRADARRKPKHPQNPLNLSSPYVTHAHAHPNTSIRQTSQKHFKQQK